MTVNVDGEGSSFTRNSSPPKDRVCAVVGQARSFNFPVFDQTITLGIANEVYIHDFVGCLMLRKYVCSIFS